MHVGKQFGLESNEASFAVTLCGTELLSWTHFTVSPTLMVMLDGEYAFSTMLTVFVTAADALSGATATTKTLRPASNASTRDGTRNRARVMCMSVATDGAPRKFNFAVDSDG